MGTRSQPFARAHAMMALVASAMAGSFGDRQQMLDMIGPYKSRGHGEGRSSNKRAKSSFKQNKRKGL
jgi:hypothetical protein